MQVGCGQVTPSSFFKGKSDFDLVSSTRNRYLNKWRNTLRKLSQPIQELSKRSEMLSVDELRQLRVERDQHFGWRKSGSITRNGRFSQEEQGQKH